MKKIYQQPEIMMSHLIVSDIILAGSEPEEYHSEFGAREDVFGYEPVSTRHSVWDDEEIEEDE